MVSTVVQLIGGPLDGGKIEWKDESKEIVNVRNGENGDTAEYKRTNPGRAVYLPLLKKSPEFGEISDL